LETRKELKQHFIQINRDESCSECLSCTYDKCSYVKRDESWKSVHMSIEMNLEKCSYVNRDESMNLEKSSYVNRDESCFE